MAAAHRWLVVVREWHRWRPIGTLLVTVLADAVRGAEVDTRRLVVGLRPGRRFCTHHVGPVQRLPVLLVAVLVHRLQVRLVELIAVDWRGQSSVGGIWLERVAVRFVELVLVAVVASGLTLVLVTRPVHCAAVGRRAVLTAGGQLVAMVVIIRRLEPDHLIGRWRPRPISRYGGVVQLARLAVGHKSRVLLVVVAVIMSRLGRAGKVAKVARSKLHSCLLKHRHLIDQLRRDRLLLGPRAVAGGGIERKRGLDHRRLRALGRWWQSSLALASDEPHCARLAPVRASHMRLMAIELV